MRTARVHAQLATCLGMSIFVCACPAPAAAPAASASTSSSASASASSASSVGGSESSDTGALECASLLDHAAWTALEADADPLAEHRPDSVECGIAGWYQEDEELEIDTNYCNYLALTQPLLAEVQAGQILQLGLYHFDLLAPDPATAHVAILIDGTIVWEREIEIPGGQDPGPAAVFSETFPSPVTASAGAPLVIHLHNHGQNTWTFQDLAGC